MFVHTSATTWWTTGALSWRWPPGTGPGAREAIHRWVLNHPDTAFVASLLTGIVVALGAVLWLAGPAARGAWIPILLLALIPASHVAISVIDQIVTALLPPRTLPRLDFGGPGGVPAECRTAVVVPTLFDSVEAVEQAFDHMEVQFLANRGAHLHFAVLSDFTDAAEETREGDAEIVAAAVARVQDLNDRYAPLSRDAFHLLHRPRRWNARQGVWMGWERKRGKLAEFNRFLRGGARDAFTHHCRQRGQLGSVRYVITLDADTVLPPGSAAELIGTLAHPLNRAVYDPDQGRVVRGYGILQPRVGVTLPSAHRVPFLSHPLRPPGRGSVHHRHLRRLPGPVRRGQLHGEGHIRRRCVRPGDARPVPREHPAVARPDRGQLRARRARHSIIVYDDYPARYLTFTRRKHRWIRGDWQLLRLADAAGPGAGRAGSQPPPAPLALEDLRQPATQHG
jgi:cyclic beta-1,2-glucan synthetase